MKTLYNRLTAVRTKKHLNPNSGQVVVLLVFMAVGLIAIMGLAIDGGRVLFLRRDTQNAADAAAMAAARAICTARMPEEYALAAADANGFDNDQTSNWVTVSSPPTDASFDIPDECVGCYVQVNVKGEIPPSFIGTVYEGELAAEASAIGVCNPDVNNVGSKAPELRAIWAMSGKCTPDPVTVTGSSITIIGGLHSNGTMKVEPGCGCTKSKVTGATSLVTPYKSYKFVQGMDKVTWSAGTAGNGGSSGATTTATGLCASSCFTGVDVSEVPADGKPYLTSVKTEYPVDYKIEQFQDGGVYAEAAKSAGKYYVFNCSTNKFWDWVLANHYHSGKLDDGIYYAACDMTITKSADNVTGKVTFVTTGKINVKGKGQQWTPYVNEKLLLFANGTEGCNGTGAIKFEGSNNSWSGQVFAPNGTIKMSGSINNSTAGCLIGLSVELSGSSNTIMCDTTESTNTPQPAFWIGS